MNFEERRELVRQLEELTTIRKRLSTAVTQRSFINLWLFGIFVLLGLRYIG